MSRSIFMAALTMMMASAVVQANQCSSGAECPSDDKLQNVVSVLQTKLQMNVLNGDGEAAANSVAPATADWAQQTNTECGATEDENNAANAAEVPMLTPNWLANPHLLDFLKGSMTLSACQATCMETQYCRAIELNSNPIDSSEIVVCKLMYAGSTGFAKDGLSCWYFTINGSIPGITEGSGDDILAGINSQVEANCSCFESCPLGRANKGEAVKCRGNVSTCTVRRCCAPKANCSSFQSCPSERPNKGEEVKCRGNASTCTVRRCCEARANCSSFESCPSERPNKGEEVKCRGNTSTCTVRRCCEPKATCSSFESCPSGRPNKGEEVKCRGNASTCTVKRCCERTTTTPPAEDTYEKLTTGSCPANRQVSKEDCLAAAKTVGADTSKTDLDGGVDAGMNGRPEGCTMHEWGNVEWWGPSDNASCGSLNYYCVCKEVVEAPAPPTTTAPDYSYNELPQSGYCRTSLNGWHCWLNVALTPLTQEGCRAACTGLSTCTAYTYDLQQTHGTGCYLYPTNCVGSSGMTVSSGGRGPWSSEGSEVCARGSDSPTSARTYLKQAR